MGGVGQGQGKGRVGWTRVGQGLGGVGWGRRGMGK